MRRVGTIAFLSLLLVATVGVPASARQHEHFRHETTFRARSTDTRPGGMILVGARVEHPTRGTAFSASAIVHFRCADVPVQLVSFGRAYAAGARVAVSPDEAPGDITIDVTIVYGDQTVPLTTTSTIRARRGSTPPADCVPPDQQEN